MSLYGSGLIVRMVWSDIDLLPIFCCSGDFLVLKTLSMTQSLFYRKLPTNNPYCTAIYIHHCIFSTSILTSEKTTGSGKPKPWNDSDSMSDSSTQCALLCSGKEIGKMANFTPLLYSSLWAWCRPLWPHNGVIKDVTWAVSQVSVK